MAYAPVLVGEVSGLRAEVEGFLSTNPDAVAERLAELHNSVYAAGYYASIGAEIEYEFIDDPTSPLLVVGAGKEYLYEKVAHRLNVWPDGYGFRKGQIVAPDDHGPALMVNPIQNGTYNPDQPGSNISESRTWPASANVGVERYWDVLDAIGQVAASHSMMALIHSTHLSTTLQRIGNTPANYYHEAGSKEYNRDHLAATQYMLNNLRLLQFDSGLQQGIVVNEAYPRTKDAMTTIHRGRLEMRHGIVGITDPRVDAIASLVAAQQAISGEVPKEAMDELRTGICFSEDLYSLGTHVLGLLGLYDPEEERIVVPAHLEPSARLELANEMLDEFVIRATGGQYMSHAAENGAVFDRIIADLRYNEQTGEVSPALSSPYVDNLMRMFDGTQLGLEDGRWRVLPNVTWESPETYAHMRANAVDSDVVRQAFGRAHSSITPAQQAVDRRQAIIDGVMIDTELLADD